MIAHSRRYYLTLAAAFVRGRCAKGHTVELPKELLETALDDLAEDALVTSFRGGRAAGLKLHKGHRMMNLARIQGVFGLLRAVGIENLLDVGSGRGVFLWPLLAEFHELPITRSTRTNPSQRDQSSTGCN